MDISSCLVIGAKYSLFVEIDRKGHCAFWAKIENSKFAGDFSLLAYIQVAFSGLLA